MALTRTAAGLLFRDDFNRADGALGADYTVVAGGANWAINTNRVVHNPAADHERVQVASMAARAGGVVQATVQRSGQVNPGLLLRWDAAGEHAYLLSLSSALEIYRRQSSAWTLLVGGAVSNAENTDHTLKFAVADGSQRGWVNGADLRSAADTALNAISGRAGLRSGAGGAGTARYDNLVVCAGNSISVTGLPTGYKIRVSRPDFTTVGQAVESGGTATLDLGAILFPADLWLEVLSGGNAVMEQVRAQISGGDVWAFAPITDGGWDARWWKRTNGTHLTVDTSVAPDVRETVATLGYVEYTVGAQAEYINARFEANFCATETGQHTLSYDADNGFRFLMDGVLVHESWGHDATVKFDVLVNLTAGQRYRFVVEHYNSFGPERLRVSFKSPSGTQFEKLPTCGDPLVAPNAAPAAPTLTVDQITQTGARLNGSAFSDPNTGDTHAASRWQVDTENTFADPLTYDSGAAGEAALLQKGVTGLTASTGYFARVQYRDSAGNWSAWSNVASFTTAAITYPPGEEPQDPQDPINATWPPRAVINAVRLAWLEVWSDVEIHKGERLAFIPHALACSDEREVGGLLKLRASAPRLLHYGPHEAIREADIGPWEHVDERRVIRAVFQDLTWEEWRVVRLDSLQGEDGSLIGTIECEHILYDANLGVSERIQTNGDVAHGYALYGLTPRAQAAEIVGDIQRPYFVLGPVEATEVLDVEYPEATPLELLRTLAGSTNLELDCWRATTGQYVIGLVERIGKDAERPHLLIGRNLRSLQASGDASEQANRVYAFGQQQEGARMDMGDAAWEVSAVTTTTLTLAGGPIAFDDQLNGLYLELAGTATRVQITDTIYATQQVVVASTTGFAVGSLVQIRRNADGVKLTHLDHPQSITYYGGGIRGLFPAPLLRDDIPGIENVAPDAFLSRWSSATALASWSVVGAPTVQRNSDKLYRQHGGHSAYISAAAAGEGVQSAMAPIRVSARSPYGSAQISLFVISGVVRLDLIVSNGTAETVLPSGRVATTSELRTWVTLSISGEDLHAIGAKTARVRVTASGGAAAWYLDAAQIEPLGTPSETFYAGRASNDLWTAANRALRERGYAAERYEVTALDLYRLDPEGFRYDELVLGAEAVIRHRGLNVDTVLRLPRVARDYLIPANTEVRLGSPPPDLTQIIAEPPQASAASSSLVLPPPESPSPPGTGGSTIVFTSPGALSNLRASRQGTGLGAHHRVEWDHNSAIGTEPNRYKVRIYEYTDSVGETLLTSTHRAVDEVSALGGTASDTTPLYGRFPSAKQFCSIAGTTCVWQQWLYTVDLLDSSPDNPAPNFPVQTLQVTVDGYYQV